MPGRKLAFSYGFAILDCVTTPFDKVSLYPLFSFLVLAAVAVFLFPNGGNKLPKANGGRRLDAGLAVASRSVC